MTTKTSESDYELKINIQTVNLKEKPESTCISIPENEPAGARRPSESLVKNYEGVAERNLKRENTFVIVTETKAENDDETVPDQNEDDDIMDEILKCKANIQEK